MSAYRQKRRASRRSSSLSKSSRSRFANSGDSGLPLRRPLRFAAQMQTPSCIMPRLQEATHDPQEDVWSAIRRGQPGDIRMSWSPPGRRTFPGPRPPRLPDRPSATYSFAFRRASCGSGVGDGSRSSSPKRYRVQQRFQRTPQDRLRCTSRSTTVGMPNCRIPARGPPGLGDLHPSHRTPARTSCPGSDAVSSCSMRGEPGFEFVDGHPVCARAPPCSPLPVDGLGANSCHRKSFPSRTRLRSRPWSGPRSRPWSRLVLGRTPCGCLRTPRTLPLRFRRRRIASWRPLRPPRG